MRLLLGFITTLGNILKEVESVDSLLQVEGTVFHVVRYTHNNYITRNILNAINNIILLN